MRLFDFARGIAGVLTVTVAVALSGCGGGGGSDFVPQNPVSVPPSFAYVTERTLGNVRGYAVDASGILTEVPGSPFATAPGIVGGAPPPIATDPGGRFVSIAVRGGMAGPLLTFRIDGTTGALSPVGTPIPTPIDPPGVAFDRAGRFQYLLTRDPAREVETRTFDSATGALGSPVATDVPGSGDVRTFAIDPTGRFMYVARLVPNEVHGLAIDSVTGVPAPAGAPAPLPSAGAPQAIAIDSTGKFLYVAFLVTPAIAGFTIDGATGALTPLAGSPFPAEPTPFLKAHPSAGLLCSGDSTIGGLAVTGIDPGTGALTAVTGSPFSVGPGTPGDVAIHPSGSFLIATFDSQVQLATIDASTGQVLALPFSASGGSELRLATTASR